jgi:hypothetical protein
MIGIVEERRTEVAALCEKYGVKRLDQASTAASSRFAVASPMVTMNLVPIA